MQFAVIGRDGKDAKALERRAAARQAHLALGDRMREEGRLLYAAALLDDAGNMAGSVMIMDFISRADLDAWLKVEPYAVGKVWETVEIKPCRVGPSFAPSR